MSVTRHVISDLWPLYESGEASPETQALVDAFLAQDPAFAKTLRESADIDLRRPELVSPVQRKASWWRWAVPAIASAASLVIGLSIGWDARETSLAHEGTPGTFTR